MGAAAAHIIWFTPLAHFNFFTAAPGVCSVHKYLGDASGRDVARLLTRAAGQLCRRGSLLGGVGAAGS